MIHAIIYLGSLDINFASLTGDTNKYCDAGGNEHAARDPSDAVNGIVFARMQRGKQEFAVRAADVVLHEPVLLVPARHSDGKGYGPNPTNFGSDSAQRLLADMAEANPNLRDRLGALREQIEVRPAVEIAALPRVAHINDTVLDGRLDRESTKNARARCTEKEDRVSTETQGPRLLRCTKCNAVSLTLAEREEGTSTRCELCGGAISETGVPSNPTPPSPWSALDAKAVMGLLAGVGLIIVCVSAFRSEPPRPRVSQATAAAVRSFYNGYEFGGGWQMTSFGLDGDIIRIGVTIPNGDDYRADPPSRIESLVQRIACVGSIRGKAVWRQIPTGQGVEVVALTPTGTVLATATCPRQYGDD